LDKDILVQYTDLQEEIRDIRRRAERAHGQMERLETEGTVLDAVKGTRQDGTFGSIRIEGFPYADYEKRRRSLQSYLLKLADMEEKLLELTNQAEEYINSIEDSRMRRIVQYRILDGLSWYEVADRMGGKATSDSCRMYFERFLQKF
jgi:hypothetical protein